jgi:hypothetical protein
MNAYNDTVTCLITTLRKNSVIIANLTQNGIIKVFGEWVDASVRLPYITVQYYSGGRDNDAQSEASDVYMKVLAVTEGVTELSYTLAQAIHDELASKVPDSSDLVGVGAYAAVEEKAPFVETYLRQNRPYHYRGGIYRVRLASIA